MRRALSHPLLLTLQIILSGCQNYPTVLDKVSSKEKSWKWIFSFLPWRVKDDGAHTSDKSLMNGPVPNAYFDTFRVEIEQLFKAKVKEDGAHTSDNSILLILYWTID